jgi:hypothetical protein
VGDLIRLVLGTIRRAEHEIVVFVVFAKEFLLMFDLPPCSSRTSTVSREIRTKGVFPDFGVLMSRPALVCETDFERHSRPLPQKPSLG